MSMIIDIIGLCIIAVAAFSAYKKGFVRTFFGLITVILAIVLATSFHKNLAAYIKDTTDLDEWISGAISDSVSNIGKDVNSGNLTSSATSAQDSFSELNSAIDTSALNGFMGGENIFSTLPDVVGEKLGVNEFKENMGSNITTSVADTAINVLSWVILYIGIQIILNIVVAILDGIMSLPLLREINNIAGLAIGIVLGVFRIYIILAVIYFISTVANISPIINAIGSSSMIASMYNNNLLLKIIF
ncbi:MAG: CvpA family protein [Clostridia bacterium]|nr:CvpA family protein [Clostridia bacterium]